MRSATEEAFPLSEMLQEARGEKTTLWPALLHAISHVPLTWKPADSEVWESNTETGGKGKECWKGRREMLAQAEE